MRLSFVETMQGTVRDEQGDVLFPVTGHLDADSILAPLRRQLIRVLPEMASRLAPLPAASRPRIELQVATWNLEGFWGLPHYPQTPYYRTFETVVRAEARMYEAEAHLYEFVVPMVPPSWNEPARVTELAEKLARSSGPTAVAVSTLDVSQPANQAGPDFYAHWGLTHFLLDGHHKLQAAAQIGRPLQLLSLLSVDASLATPEQVQSVPELLTRPASRRPGPT